MPKRNKKGKKNKKRSNTKFSRKLKKNPLQDRTVAQTIQLAAQLYQVGNTLEAEQLCHQVLSVDPLNADAYHYLGYSACQEGKYDKAIKFIQKATQVTPQNIEAYYNLGNTFKKIGKMNEAVASYKKVLSINSNFVAAHYNLGNAFTELDQLDEAISCYKQALVIKPDYVKALNNLGDVFRRQGLLTEASSCYKQALAIDSGNVLTYNSLGIVYKELGQIDDAISCFRQALLIKPDFTEAHRFLSELILHTQYDDTIRNMESLYVKKNLSDEQRMHLAFGLGKVFSDIKEYEKSFDFITAGNRLKRRSFVYSKHHNNEFIKKIINTFSSSFFSSHHKSGNHDKIPIFIIGMPRSGTSLAEQILATHPLVFGAGELKYLLQLAHNLCDEKRPEKYPDCLSYLKADVFKKVGSEYINKVRKHSKDAKFIIDKMPHNFLHVGLIKLILPNAKVIHCMRDPMDNCLSIFKTYFGESGSHKYAYDMNELGEYYRLYLNLMEHWHKVLPDYLHDLRYEEMVSDQKNSTQKLLEFCGLPWEEDCLSFYKTKRRVATASDMQVRRPIYQDSVKLWKKYETQLAPIFKALYL